MWEQWEWLTIWLVEANFRLVEVEQGLCADMKGPVHICRYVGAMSNYLAGWSKEKDGLVWVTWPWCADMKALGQLCRKTKTETWVYGTRFEIWEIHPFDNKIFRQHENMSLNEWIWKMKGDRCFFKGILRDHGHSVQIWRPLSRYVDGEEEKTVKGLRPCSTWDISVWRVKIKVSREIGFTSVLHMLWDCHYVTIWDEWIEQDLALREKKKKKCFFGGFGFDIDWVGIYGTY